MTGQHLFGQLVWYNILEYNLKWVVLFLVNIGNENKEIVYATQPTDLKENPSEQLSVSEHIPQQPYYIDVANTNNILTPGNLNNLVVILFYNKVIIFQH